MRLSRDRAEGRSTIAPSGSEWMYTTVGQYVHYPTAELLPVQLYGTGACTNYLGIQLMRDGTDIDVSMKHSTYGTGTGIDAPTKH